MKETNLFKTLPALALALALGACGGGGSDSNPSDTNPEPAQPASITACFTATKTVSYAIKSINLPANTAGPTQSTVGPMTYNNQTVTGQTLFYSRTTISKLTEYWSVTDSGVMLLATETTAPNSSNPYPAVPINVFIPANLAAGQSVGTLTFAGFETLTLAGKTFANTCHMVSGSDDAWYAPGYGNVKQILSGATTQYNGGL